MSTLKDNLKLSPPASLHPVTSTSGEHVKSSPQSPAGLVAPDLLVQPQDCLSLQPVAVVQQPCYEGQVYTQERTVCGWLAASCLRRVKKLLDSDHSALATGDEASIHCSVMEVGEGSNLPGWNLPTLVNTQARLYITACTPCMQASYPTMVLEGEMVYFFS